jgi:hypothetical protein
MAASALSVENGIGFQHTPHEVVTGDEKVSLRSPCLLHANRREIARVRAARTPPSQTKQDLPRPPFWLGLFFSSSGASRDIGDGRHVPATEPGRGARVQRLIALGCFGTTQPRLFLRLTNWQGFSEINFT